MTLPAAIFTYLSAEDIVGTRIYPAPLPEKVTLPAISYSVISTDRPFTNSGPVELIDQRVQFDCWGKTYDSATEVARRLVGAVHAFHDDYWGTTKIGVAYADNELDLYDANSGIHRRIVDVIVKHVPDPVLIGS